MSGEAALVSTKPFCGVLASGTVRMVLKFFRLSKDRWILICLIVSKEFVQPTTILLPPIFFKENLGSVSCACRKGEKRNKMKSKASLFMLNIKIRIGSRSATKDNTGNF